MTKLSFAKLIKIFDKTILAKKFVKLLDLEFRQTKSTMFLDKEFKRRFFRKTYIQIRQRFSAKFEIEN